MRLCTHARTVASAAEARGELEEALRHYSDSVEASRGGLAEAHFNKGNVLRKLRSRFASEAEWVKAVENDYRRAIAARKRAGSRYTRAWLNLGALLQRHGGDERLADAVVAFSNVAEDEEFLVGGGLARQLADLLRDNGALDAAARALKAALSVEPGEPSLWRVYAELRENLGAAAAELAGIYREAVSAAATEDPINLHNLATILSSRNELEEALEMSTRALSAVEGGGGGGGGIPGRGCGRDSVDDDLWRRVAAELGTTLQWLGREEEARALYGAGVDCGVWEDPLQRESD